MSRSGRLTGGESGHLLPLDALYAFLIVPFQNFFLRIRCVIFALKSKKERGVSAGAIAGAVLAAFAALVLLVLAMTQKAADKYWKDLNPAGLLVLDEQLVPNVPDFPHVVRIPITKLAIEKVGKPLFANIVALGALVRLTGIVSFDAIKKAVANRVPPHTVEANMKALELGWEAAAAKA